MKSRNNSGKYIIYFPNTNTSGYFRYYLKYRIYQDNFLIIDNFEDLQNISEYQYLTIANIDSNVKKFFNQYSNLVPSNETYLIEEFDLSNNFPE